MKKLLIAICLITLTSSAMLAGNPKTLSSFTPEQRINYDIKTQIAMPRYLSEVPGDYSAELHFHVTSDGSIIINEVTSNSDDLKNSILAQSKNIKVGTAGLDTESSYKVTVRFQVIESN